MSDIRIFKDKASVSCFLYALWLTLTDEPPTEEELKEIYERYAEDEDNEEI